jgi:hypothetical protein
LGGLKCRATTLLVKGEPEGGGQAACTSDPPTNALGLMPLICRCASPILRPPERCGCSGCLGLAGMQAEGRPARFGQNPPTRGLNCFCYPKAHWCCSSPPPPPRAGGGGGGGGGGGWGWWGGGGGGALLKWGFSDWGGAGPAPPQAQNPHSCTMNGRSSRSGSKALGMNAWGICGREGGGELIKSVQRPPTGMVPVAQPLIFIDIATQHFTVTCRALDKSYVK